MKRYKLWKGLPEVQWDLAVCSNEAVRGKKRKTIEFYFGYLVFEVLGDRRNMLLRKTLESQKEAENVGLLLQRKVRTGRKRSRDHPQRRDISQKLSKQKRETLREHSYLSLMERKKWAEWEDTSNTSEASDF